MRPARSLILRFLVAYVCCLAGLEVAFIAGPDPMGPTPFWEKVGAVFSYSFYSRELFVAVFVASSLLLLADWIGPKRIHIAWLALIAAFFSGYFYTMGARDYFGDFDSGIGLYLEPIPLGPFRNPVGLTFFLIVWLFPVVLLAAIKLAGLPGRRVVVSTGDDA